MGRASQTATGTSQRRPVAAPKATRTAAITVRGTRSWLRPGDARRNANQSDQADGARAKETATTAAVPPRARASARHSRRTANHRTPRPGVTFVRIGKAQVAGARNPRTIAAAIRKCTLPTSSS